jgi:hypothetical protein
LNFPCELKLTPPENLKAEKEKIYKIKPLG